MALISSTIPNFVNGVSQQPFTLRMASQGESQENGLSTVAQGLKKRPGTKHLKKIFPLPLDGSFVHIINRDEQERYVVAVWSKNIKVFDLNGNEKTVLAPNGTAYLTCANPALDIRAVTVADYTFFVNRTMAVAEAVGNSQNTRTGYEALINVKAGNYGKTYSVFFNGGTAASHTTPNGASATDSPAINTDAIASAIAQQIRAYAPALTVYQNGSVLYLKHTANFTLTCDDGFNGNAMVVIKERLQRFSDLPNRGVVDGYTVEIVGDSNSSFDNYFVRWDSQGGASSGVWKETCKPGTSVGVHWHTMPHALVRNADGSFSFKQLEWVQRRVGDEHSNPNPSFMNKTIRDVFFYRNRLGFLSDENVIFSEAGSYFNVYRTTVTQLLDADPIDVSVSHTKVSVLEHAIPFNKQLLLFSSQTQFVLDQNELLTPKTVSIKQSTEFPCNTVAKPVGIGKNIYFAVDKGGFSAVREYFADFNNISNDSTDVTGHIPKYIPSGVYKITAAPNEDIICWLSNKDRNSLYVYKYFWANNEKLQSSWSRWTFGPQDVILNAEFVMSELFLVIQRPDGVYLEKMDVALGAQDSYESYQTLLDRRMVVVKAQTWYANGRTMWLPSFPYVTGEEQLAVTAKGGSKKAGVVLTVKWDGTNSYVEGDYTGTDLIVGRSYLFRYQLSTITVKQQQPGGGQKSDTEGRLQLRKLSINYADTGFFDVKVTPKARSTYSYRYAGKVLGAESATIGVVSMDTGRFTLPIMTRNTDTAIVLENATPIPCSFLSADWEGFYVKRSQPV